MEEKITADRVVFFLGRTAADDFGEILMPSGNGRGPGDSTYFGGTSSESNPSIAVDNQGSVYVAGETNSADFPVTGDAFQPCSRAPGYPGSAFAARFQPGSSLPYSTFLGGSGGAGATGIAVDQTGSIYIIGDMFPEYVPVPGNPNLYIPENDFPPPPAVLSLIGATEPGGPSSKRGCAKRPPTSSRKCHGDALDWFHDPIWDCGRLRKRF